MTMKSLQVIGTEITAYLPRQTIDGVIVEIDNKLYFSHKIKTSLGFTWVSLDQLEIRQPQKKLGVSK